MTRRLVHRSARGRVKQMRRASRLSGVIRGRAAASCMRAVTRSWAMVSNLTLRRCDSLTSRAKASSASIERGHQQALCLSDDSGTVDASMHLRAVLGGEVSVPTGGARSATACRLSVAAPSVPPRATLKASRASARLSRSAASASLGGRPVSAHAGDIPRNRAIWLARRPAAAVSTTGPRPDDRHGPPPGRSSAVPTRR